MTIILITGGTRSGKSVRAEARVRAFVGQPIYLATAEALDVEMSERIAQHRARRGPEWIARDVPLDLAQALIETDGGGARLIDCLTLWLSNLMHRERDVARETSLLVQTLARQRSPVVLVTNEVGMGLVPETPLGRDFRDVAGLAHQRLARDADEVHVGVLGLMLRLRPGPVTVHEAGP